MHGGGGLAHRSEAVLLTPSIYPTGRHRDGRELCAIFDEDDELCATCSTKVRQCTIVLPDECLGYGLVA